MHPHARQKETRRDADGERSRILAAFRATFTTDHGELVLAILRASAGCGKPSFLPAPGGGPFDPLAAAYRDGRKSILDEIQSHLDTPEDAGPEAKPGVKA